MRPRLLLLDEPFNGIDLTLRQSLIRHLREMSSSPDLDHLGQPLSFGREPIGADIAVLEEGVICEMGLPEVLCKEPRSRTIVQMGIRIRMKWNSELG